MDKKIIIAIVILFILLAIGRALAIKSKITNSVTKLTSEGEDEVVENTTGNKNAKDENKTTITGKYYATITIKDYGTIKLELDADTAPITVANFIKLVNEGFYDGLTFHRIIDGFMIQGGDPLGTGMGGSDENIKGEFKANGVENNISHVRGVISMARATSYNSASSQFFIVQKDSKYLDGQYAGFGKVLSGMEIVDRICEVTPVEDDNGTVLKENQPIIESIKIDN